MVRYYTKQSYLQADNMIRSKSRTTELPIFEIKLLKHIFGKSWFLGKNTGGLQQSHTSGHLKLCLIITTVKNV
jgi:hypothetical protein